MIDAASKCSFFMLLVLDKTNQEKRNLTIHNDFTPSVDSLVVKSQTERGARKLRGRVRKQDIIPFG